MTEPLNKSEVADAYDDWAETYDTVPNRTRDLAGQVLRQVGLNLNGRALVEVGCGTGRNTEWLARAAAGSSDAAGPESIVALDFSEEMLARARLRVNDRRVSFIQHDVQQRWPLANASADVVIAMLILEHVEHLEPFFAEAARILRDGGELFICELHPMRQHLGSQAQFTSNKTGEHTRVPAFLHDVSDYVNAAASCGFELVDKNDWCDEDATPDAAPRLLSFRYRLPSRQS